MRFLAVALLLGSTFALAEPLPQRPSARLLADSPDAFAPGRCLVYEEGGGGGVISEPRYRLRGSAIAAGVRTIRQERCPIVPGRRVEQYTRAEFNRLALAYPCLAGDATPREVQAGIVRLRVSDWETPHERKAENAGRLYRGHFIDRELKKDMEIELEADLLGPCAP